MDRSGRRCFLIATKFLSCSSIRAENDARSSWDQRDLTFSRNYSFFWVTVDVQKILLHESTPSYLGRSCAEQRQWLFLRRIGSQTGHLGQFLGRTSSQPPEQLCRELDPPVYFSMTTTSSDPVPNYIFKLGVETITFSSSQGGDGSQTWSPHKPSVNASSVRTKKNENRIVLFIERIYRNKV
jgi:hypothetical protein